MSASPRPQKRIATTCVTCRVRKVRCDGRRNICTNCERLGFACHYDDNAGMEPAPADSPGPPVSVPRRRVRQACQACHAKKARCSGAVPRCDRCRQQGLECVYRPGKRALPLPSPGINSSDAVIRDGPDHYDQGNFTHASASPVASGFEPPEPDEALSMRAFDAFFRHVHHIPMFSFLHRASLMERYHAGTLDHSLLLAIIGITALLADLGSGMDEYGERCIDEASALCLGELEKPSILRLQALVLVIKHRILSRRLSCAFMLHAVASRFATVLRLNHENPSLCFLARESRRRLMWSIYMIDSALAGGQSDFALWPDAERQINIQLPCNERHFEFDLPERTEPLRPPPPGLDGLPPPMPDVVGFMALHVRIHWMRTRILQCTTKAAAALTVHDLVALPSQCASLDAELDAFEARMPQSFRWSEGNLRLRTYSPRLGIFVMTHVWWRQCHLDLYRLFLPGLKEALPPALLAQLDPGFVAEGRRRCYEHAKATADMFAQLLGLGSSASPVTDLDLPGCAFQCARVLYHGLQTVGTGMGFTTDSVRELAGVCLQVARQSTAGSACAGIVSPPIYRVWDKVLTTKQQADIEKLITEGLPLLGSSASPDTMSMDHLSQHQQPNTSEMSSAYSTATIIPAATTATAMSPPAHHHQHPHLAAQIGAVSNMSGGTSGTNAFEETVDAFGFGDGGLEPDASWASVVVAGFNFSMTGGSTAGSGGVGGGGGWGAGGLDLGDAYG